MRSIRNRIEASSTRIPSLWAGALLSLAIGGMLYFATARTIDADAGERFNNMAQASRYTIAGRIKSYTDLLRGAAGLFQADQHVTRDQFHRYVEGLDMANHFPGIEVINFARVVPAAEREEFEQRMRAEMARARPGSPPFTIRPPGKRPSYTVIIYIEPSVPWLDKFGLDLEGRQYTTRTLAESRDSGALTASGTRVAILSGPNQHGLAMRLPVYRNDMPSRTVEERRAAYFGTVGIGFGVNKLVKGVLDEMPIRGTRLTMLDLTPVPPEPGERRQIQVLFDSEATSANPAPPFDPHDASHFHASHGR